MDDRMLDFLLVPTYCYLIRYRYIHLNVKCMKITRLSFFSRLEALMHRTGEGFDLNDQRMRSPGLEQQGVDKRTIASASGHVSYTPGILPTRTPWNLALSALGIATDAQL